MGACVWAARLAVDFSLTPQPIIKSTMPCGSSAGTVANAARAIWLARSSGRMSINEPLPARRSATARSQR